MARLSKCIVILCLLLPFPVMAQSDADIKRKIIAQSIASYSGSCPCPYNTDRAGRKCGKRSAYSKPGGYSPICYESDVTQEMIEDYRATNGVK